MNEDIVAITLTTEAEKWERKAKLHEDEKRMHENSVAEHASASEICSQRAVALRAASQSWVTLRLK